MRSPQEFRHVVRQGARTGRSTLVVHAAATSAADGVKVGFVVPKAVGNAVMRNRVRRRLRHLVLGQLAATPLGTAVVVRALPPAASRPAELPADFVAAWGKTLQRLHRRSTSQSPAASSSL